MVQFPVQIFEFKYFSDEKVAVTMSDFSVRYVYHVVVNVKIELEKNHHQFHLKIPLPIQTYLRSTLKFAFQPRSPLRPNHVLHLVLEAQQMNQERFDLLIQIYLLRLVIHVRLLVLRHESGQLTQRQCRVQLEVASYRGKHPLLLNLVHEHLRLVADRLLRVVLRLRVQRRRTRQQELRAREREAVLELLQVAILHLVHLLMVALLAKCLLYGLIDALRMEHQANSKEMIHLVGLLVYLVVLVALRCE